ncbi:hypothetical protein GLI01_02670 [Gluconacetobacter liquefaciens]|nr:hypothetical protein GLI01_02670 [Gluconacetobacter liquefaciens]
MAVWHMIQQQAERSGYAEALHAPGDLDATPGGQVVGEAPHDLRAIIGRSVIPPDKSPRRMGLLPQRLEQRIEKGGAVMDG